ncbi:hypothetical protein [Saccharopolyspora hattusasensis]
MRFLVVAEVAAHVGTAAGHLHQPVRTALAERLAGPGRQISRGH